MSSNSPKERKALEKLTAPVDTALPPFATGNVPARALSGAFAAALGGKPQVGHAGAKALLGKERGKTVVEEAASARMKINKPSATTTPRKGHR